MSHKILKTELGILEKNFPRNDGCFQIILASPEELVCRFIDTKGDKYNLQCNISVSGIHNSTVYEPTMLSPPPPPYYSQTTP